MCNANRERERAAWVREQTQVNDICTENHEEMKISGICNAEREMVP